MVSLAKGQSIRLGKSGGGTSTRAAMGLGWDVRKAGGLRGLFGGGDRWDMKAIVENISGRTFHDMMPAIGAHL